MKLKYFILTGLALTALSSCDDYLDVEAPSKYDNEYVFSKESEIEYALNGVYAQLLNGNTYGSKYLTTFCFNSDVDFSANSSETATNDGFRRFECNSEAGNLNSTWSAAYSGVETANNFIYNLENSSIYSEDNENLTQMMGEAKVIRAMFYNDLIDLWGDIPFNLMPTSMKTEYVDPIVDRTEIRKQLIEDLKSIAPKMKFSSEINNTVERISKEACWAMISRMALSAGGYSLRPDKANATSRGKMERPSNYKEFYKIARDYADSVITSGTHKLTLSYQDVFTSECNFIVSNGDDVIFEIPFTKKTSGNIGYDQGPTGNNYEGYTQGLNTWGKAGGGARLAAHYRFSFDEADLRRDFINGMWYYLYDGTPSIRADYTVHNNKWSKFWNSNGAFETISEGNTGINFPYLRYTDVLLMFAEADNELNDGPTDKAMQCLREVRNRAFKAEDQALKVEAYIAAASGSKESFLKAVLDERKWEFAGENMRWKDLVRNNMYAETLYYTFARLYGQGENAGATSMWLEAAEQYDGVAEGRYSMDMPFDLFYVIVPNADGNIANYPNKTLNVLYFYNAYNNVQRPSTDLMPANAMDADGNKPNQWLTGSFYQWWNEGVGTPTNQCMYSLYGFMRGKTGSSDVILVNNDGTETTISSPLADLSQLPVVRYILPYPNAVIQRSAGAYKNYYGYTK